MKRVQGSKQVANRHRDEGNFDIDLHIHIKISTAQAL